MRIHETGQAGDIPFKHPELQPHAAGTETGAFALEPQQTFMTPFDTPRAAHPETASIKGLDTASEPGLDSPAFTLLDGEHFIPTYNPFYRMYHRNSALVGNIIAPTMAATGVTKGPVRILDVGCSEGRDTWCLASVLALHDIDYHIHAVDVNPEVLKETTKPYRGTQQELQNRIEYWEVPVQAADFFDVVDAEHIEPSQLLRDHVSFERMDFRQAGADDIYDIVISNNVLTHYKDIPVLLEQMVTNIAGSMRIGGLFTFSEFTTWQAVAKSGMLARHGLIPAENTYGIDDEKWQDIKIYQKVPLAPARRHRVASALRSLIRQ